MVCCGATRALALLALQRGHRELPGAVLAPGTALLPPAATAPHSGAPRRVGGDGWDRGARCPLSLPAGTAPGTHTWHLQEPASSPESPEPSLQLSRGNSTPLTHREPGKHERCEEDTQAQEHPKQRESLADGNTKPHVGILHKNLILTDCSLVCTGTLTVPQRGGKA